MNPEIKQKWVTALRSGEYKQGRGVLHRNDKFCCLGVLCEIAIAEGVAVDKHAYADGDTYYDYTGSYLPASVYEWAGLSSSPAVYDGHRETNLANVNDGGASFAEIADIIEEQL